MAIILIKTNYDKDDNSNDQDKDTVSKEHQYNEVGAEEHALLVDTTTGTDPIVHDLIPILPCQDLRQKQEY